MEFWSVGNSYHEKHIHNRRRRRRRPLRRRHRRRRALYQIAVELET